MSFPTTSILDNFDRADDTDITGSESWIASPFALGGLALYNNRLENRQVAYRANYWDVSIADAEAYVTIVSGAYASGDNEAIVGVRYTGAGNASGYFVWWRNNGGSQNVELWKHTGDGGSAQLGSSYGVTFSGGEKIGISAIGTTIKAYIYSSGAWSNVITETDSSYSSGKFWLYSRSNAFTADVILDDFGGGEYVAPSGHPRGLRGRNVPYMRTW